jgi:hypothetical protein
MNRVMRLNGRHKVTPDYATLFPKIAVLLVVIVEQVDEFGHSLLVKIVLGGHMHERVVVVVEHAAIEEYAGPVEGCEACDYFEI